MAVALLSLFMLNGCNRPAATPAGNEGGTSTAEATPATPPPITLPTPEPTPEEPKFVHDPSPQVSILGYHRFEEKPKDALALSPSDLEAQMQQIADAGIPVISMQDFLAWRRGEKNIPPRAVVITIDDGYDCTYKIAKPVFEKFGYPFTIFVYLNYIEAGGRSMTWAELAELRDAGVEIGSHSVSHASLTKRKGRSEAEFAAFIKDEMGRSKATLEEKLGIQVVTFAYPYGQFGKEAREIGRALGYEALFTVNGQISNYDTPADEIGRFVIQSTMPEIFQSAIRFKNATAGLDAYANAAVPPGADVSSPADASAAHGPELPVTPANGSTITETRPLLSADLSSFGDIDPASLQMRITGFGALPVSWDTTTKTVSCQIPESLRPQIYTVEVEAKASGQKRTLTWSFSVGR